VDPCPLRRRRRLPAAQLGIGAHMGNATKFVYFFGGGRADGNASMRNLLGGKGAGLAEMTNLGVPVPPGFTLTTEVCTYFYQNQRRYPEVLAAQVEEALGRVEAE